MLHILRSTRFVRCLTLISLAQHRVTHKKYFVMTDTFKLTRVFRQSLLAFFLEVGCGTVSLPRFWFSFPPYSEPGYDYLQVARPVRVHPEQFCLSNFVLRRPFFHPGLARPFLVAACPPIQVRLQV